MQRDQDILSELTRTANSLDQSGLYAQADAVTDALTRLASGSQDPFHLERFVGAQNGAYPQALQEIRQGSKRSHWMWYIFPQFTGLGNSDMSQRFAIHSLSEAKAYLKHPILGRRLRECASAVMDLQVANARRVFGAVDDMKLRSSLTLFAEVSTPNSIFHRLIDRFYHGQPDAATLRLATGAGVRTAQTASPQPTNGMNAVLTQLATLMSDLGGNTLIPYASRQQMSTLLNQLYTQLYPYATAGQAMAPGWNQPRTGNDPFQKHAQAAGALATVGRTTQMSQYVAKLNTIRQQVQTLLGPRAPAAAQSAGQAIEQINDLIGRLPDKPTTNDLTGTSSQGQDMGVNGDGKYSDGSPMWRDHYDWEHPGTPEYQFIYSDPARSQYTIEQRYAQFAQQFGADKAKQWMHTMGVSNAQQASILQSVSGASAAPTAQGTVAPATQGTPAPAATYNGAAANNPYGGEAGYDPNAWSGEAPASNGYQAAPVAQYAYPPMQGTSYPAASSYQEPANYYSSGAQPNPYSALQQTMRPAAPAVPTTPAPAAPVPAARPATVPPTARR